MTLRRLNIGILLFLTLTICSFRADDLIAKVREPDLVEKLKKCTSKADIIFLIDSSHSVGKEDFTKQLLAVHDMILFMTEGKKSDQFRFGAVTYSTKADMEMSLKDFADQPEAAARYIKDAIQYRPGQTGIGEGLKLIEMVGFDEGSGHRKDAEAVVILIAGTEGNTDTYPAKIASDLRQKKINVFSIGVGNQISESYLTSISNENKYVLMSNSFENLALTKMDIEGMICHHFLHAPEPTTHGPCPAGQKLIKNECVIVGPTCKKECPENYILVYPCMCIVEVGKCPNACPKGKINNKECICIPEHPEKCLLKECPPRYTLDKDRCKCVCKKQCNKNLFTLDQGSCQCLCNSKCSLNYILDPKTCTCNKITCGKGYILYRGKCRNDIHTICQHDELLFRDICLKQSECPNGYKNEQGICKPECENGTDDDGNCENVCKPGEYFLNGKCTKVNPITCSNNSHFSVPAPLCPKTCEEPVPLTRCTVKKTPEPGCVCDQGFFLYEGKCIRASECPNKPICLKQADILFMIESGVDVGEQNFYTMKSFVHSVLQQFEMRDGTKQRASVVTFNEKLHVYTTFNDFRNLTHEEVLERVINIKYKPGETFLGEALHFARSRIFVMGNGLREDVPRMMVLLTRGNPSAGKIDEFWEARKLREAGVNFVIIGIGENIESKTDDLFKLAGSGGKVFVFALRKLQQIHEMVSRVIATRCDKFTCPKARIIRRDCIKEYQQLDRVEFYTNGYKCQKTIIQDWKRVRCACPKSRTVRTSCKGMYREIIKYDYILDKNKLVCSEKSTHMRIRCRCPHVQVHVDDCRDMIKRTKYTFYRLVPGGPEGYRCDSQISWRSVRCDCPQREITHGPCINNFRVRKTKLYDLIQGQCVARFKKTEIQCACNKPKIETSACDGSHVAVRVSLKKLDQENICQESTFVGFKPCKQSCKNAMDVGILVDTSKSIDYTNFPHIRRFVASFVDKLPVSRDGTHIALGRFSSNHKIGLLFNFYTFYKAKEAVERINDMRYHPGSSSTGEGLQVMRMNAFAHSHGSRRDASRVLYLITDTESNGDVNVEEEAKRLRGMGVQIVVIGVGKNINPGYLQKLASKPYSMNVFTVRDFDDLNSIRDQALESRCNAPGTINHISVMKDISAKLREIEAQGGTDFSSLGLTMLDRDQMALITFKIDDYFTVVAGTHEWQQAKFKSDIKDTIAKTLKVKVYEIVDFKTITHEADTKEIEISFKIARDKGAEFIKIYQAKTLKLESISHKPLTLDAAIAYISPFALKGYELTRQVLNWLKEITEEIQELILIFNPQDKEDLENKLHILNNGSMKAKDLLKTDQTELVNLCLNINKESLNLANSYNNISKVLANETLTMGNVSVWDSHLVGRHLKNLHEFSEHIALKAAGAITNLKIAQNDDVVKGKVLPMTVSTTALPAVSAK